MGCVLAVHTPLDVYFVIDLRVHCGISPAVSVQVAQFGGDASRAAQQVQRLESELTRMQALQKATMERAAAAEEKERARSETIMELHNELSKLRER